MERSDQGWDLKLVMFLGVCFESWSWCGGDFQANYEEFLNCILLDGDKSERFVGFGILNANDGC